MTSFGPPEQVPSFRIADDLPNGTTVLEASAGTGKTWTIAALATRYVAEGIDLSRLLLVTFGRMASEELRDRVRGQLADAERWLAADGCEEEASAQPGADQPLRHLLLAGSVEDRSRRRERLRTALAGFDGATIATTHTFCLRMLAGLGVAGDHDPNAELSDDLSELFRQVGQETYLARYAELATPPISVAQSEELARAVLGRRENRLEPAAAETGSIGAARRELAVALLAGVEERKRREQVLDYDDLQNRLLAALRHPVSGGRARELLRSRFQVVMVDEFQDTDEVQWAILRTAFHEHTTLVLIGDPKQAIYAFRGGDVQTYLQATTAAHRLGLDTNHRSDADLVDAQQHLLAGLALGDPQIVVRRVEARHPGSRLRGAGAPLRLRRVPLIEEYQVQRRPLMKVAEVRELIARDLAADVVRTLAAGRLGPGERSVRPGDIAVLIGQNKHATLIAEALAEVGVPAVIVGGSSVFAGPAAEHWRSLLRALEAPQRLSLVKAAAITPLLGWNGDRLATATDADLDQLVVEVGRLARLLAERGIAAVVENIATTTDLAARLLSGPDGERLLTDLRHIGEALQEVARRDHLGVTGLLEWLGERVEQAGADLDRERSRRLVSDAAAVQIVTVHRAKGLEYPIVYLPYAADRHVQTDPFPLYLHDDSGAGVIDLGTADDPGHQARVRRHLAEDAGEDLRKLYVGLTRAASQVVTWWAPTTTTAASALHRVLFAPRGFGGELPDSAPVPKEAEAADRLAALAASSGGRISVELLRPADLETRQRATHTSTQPRADARDLSDIESIVPEELSVRILRRTVDTGWRRTSYTGLTAGLRHVAEPASEPDELDVLADEPSEQAEDALPLGVTLDADPAGEYANDLERARSIPAQLEGCGAGAGFGTVVHEVLERLQPREHAADLGAELRRLCREVARRRGGVVDPVLLADSLEPCLRTPLAPVSDLTLAEIPAADRLPEVSFELPLAGGDQPTARAVVLGQLADLLEAELPARHPLSPYPSRLRDPELAAQPLRGYLTGSLDAVLRLPAADGAGRRYLVIDYKTNRVPAARPEGLTAYDYRPAALAAAMMDSHYPLQALLYSVALHRFLRWRLPDYQPARHLGGVGYLFLRGMCGPDTPVLSGSSCGVFGWNPGANLVARLSDLLAGAGPAAASTESQGTRR